MIKLQPHSLLKKKKKERKKERAHINKISLKVRELQPIPKNKNNHKIIL